MLLMTKTLIEKQPYCLGKLLARIPFTWRLGRVYSRFSVLAAKSEQWNDIERESYILENFRKIYEYAIQKFPFYRDLYRTHGVSALKINSLDDIRRLPIVTKAMLRDRLEEFSGTFHLNTGGTTGTPFAFYVDKNAWAREWAHMHHIWHLLGYDYRDSCLAFRGKNLKGRNIVYNPVHNEFLINTYRPLGEFSDKFLKLIRKHPVFFVHGYPSSVYNFLKEAEQVFGASAMSEICGKIKGILLHSEYPYEYMKDEFAKYKLPWISWYGHSEMCILAYERNYDNRYRPLVTYGLAEVIDGHLLGTSYHNFDMPLIRYDTGDLVEAREVTPGGICTEFEITAGRSGDYITDRNGKQIPLTSLIFGRHHQAFDYADHIQIHQDEPGKATIYLITSKPVPKKLEMLFDLSHVDIIFELAVREKPQLSPAGKLRLKI